MRGLEGAEREAVLRDRRDHGGDSGRRVERLGIPFPQLSQLECPGDGLEHLEERDTE
ncbi:MAG TPA: hypothetical protein VMF07_14200 [Solirubrobacteraceae bacterium]|nr:hypothetical protein [Solirubrobacteraceae bacterium]